jgi:formylglycine-generating enzyme required for sulfatase activity
MRYLFCVFFLLLVFFLSAQGESGFRRARKGNEGPKIVKPKTPGQPKEPSEIPFLTITITSDMDGDIYLGEKEKKTVNANEPATFTLYRESGTLFFTGLEKDGFNYKEDLKFNPDQKGSQQEKHLKLSRKYSLFKLAREKESEDALTMLYLTNSMVPWQPEVVPYQDSLINEMPLEPFEMSRYEVTLSQFEVFARMVGAADDKGKIDSALIITVPSGVRRFKPGVNWQHDPFGRLKPHVEYDHPVVNVSYYEAEAFCRWLTESNSDYQYRLPTKAEWEYVASCGGYYFYPWGNDLEVIDSTSIPANTADTEMKRAVPKYAGFVSEESDGYATTCPVEKFPMECTGSMCNMAGNVAEWINHDIFRQALGKKALEKGVKGGSFYTAPSACGVRETASREPYQRFGTIGFRVVRVLKGLVRERD